MSASWSVASSAPSRLGAQMRVATARPYDVHSAPLSRLVSERPEERGGVALLDHVGDDRQRRRVVEQQQRVGDEAEHRLRRAERAARRGVAGGAEDGGVREELLDERALLLSPSTRHRVVQPEEQPSQLAKKAKASRVANE